MFLRAHTGGIGYACLLKVREDKNGQMVIGFQETPSGQTLLFLPFPGGHLKFFIVYDEISRLVLDGIQSIFRFYADDKLIT